MPSKMSSFTSKNVSIRLSPILAKGATSFFARQLRNPIFILGCGRSGTTLTARLLATHADVAEWSGANAIWDPGWYPWRESLVGKPPIEVDAEAFNWRWWTEAEPRLDTIRATFGAFQWMNRRKCFVNKSPFHTFRIPQLAATFPDARFIHVVRDGRAVAYSYARHLQGKGKLREWPSGLRRRFEASTDQLALWLARFWVTSLHEVESHVGNSGSTARVLQVRYEDVCANPTGSLHRVCDWVGLKDSGFGTRLDTLRLTSRNDKWRDSLSLETQARFVDLLHDELTRLGYEI